jgi:transposase-like protein
MFKMKNKRKPGRRSTYSAEMCDLAYEMLCLGASKIHVAAKLGVNRDTLYAWCKKYPEFEDAIDRGLVCAEVYWTELGQEAILGKRKLNFRLYRVLMRNRFGWKMG